MRVDLPLACRLPGEVRLVSLSAADGAEFAAHVLPDVDRLAEFLPWPVPTSQPDGAATWLGRYDAAEEGRVLAAGIRADGRLVGGIVLFHHDPASRAVELGCWAVAEAEGTGAVRAACVEALRIARHDLGVERVEWRCDPLNTRSVTLAERLGFVREGVLRSSYVLRDERRDTVVLGMVGAEVDDAVARG